MKNPAVILLLTAAAAINLAAAEPVISLHGQDAALFAGRSDDSLRYLRLGELALENDHPAVAAEYLALALKSLNDPAQRRLASDLLLESLLADRRLAEADILLDKLQKSTDFADHGRDLQLMQARRLFYDGKLNEAAQICRTLTVRLSSEDRVCQQALPLLGRILGLQGDHAGAQKCYADLAAVSAKDGLMHYKALEGLIFHALAVGDVNSAQQAYQSITREMTPDLQQEFKGRLQKLQWLIECATGAGEKLAGTILNFMEKASAPDPLLARIALTMAHSAKDLAERVKFAEWAGKFAETAFRENALIGLIEAESAAGYWQKALSNAEKYLQEYSNSLNSWQIRSAAAALCARLNRNDEAIERFRKLFDDDRAPRKLRLEAAVSLAKLYQKSQRVQDAVAMFRFAIEAPELTAAERCELQQQLGEYFYQLGRYNEAAASFAVAADSTVAGAENSALWHAQTLYQLKNYPKSRSVLKKIRNSLDPDLQRKALYLDAILEENMAGADASIGLFIEFARRYSKAPEAPEALFHAGTLAMQSSRFDAAEIFREFAERYPGEKAANAMYKALLQELTAGDSKGAEEIFGALCSRYPESKYTVGAYFLMVENLCCKQRRDEALKLLAQLEEKYTALHKDLLPEILYDRASIYREIGDWEKMRQTLEMIVHQHGAHPVVSQAFFMLGDLLMQRQDYGAALTAFKQAHERSTGIFAAACAGRAADAAYALYTRTRQEQYLRQARDWYNGLLQMPHLPVGLRYQSLYKVGRCLADEGDTAGALRCFRDLLYQAVLAQREKRFYPAEWSAKAADAAMKMVRAAIEETADSRQRDTLTRELTRLEKNARELGLPGFGKTTPGTEKK